MAGILDRVASRLGYIPRPTPEPARLAKRRFEAAQSGRLFASWPAANTSLDYDLRASLAALRGRSRHLAQNNDYAQRFLQMCKTHVVGPAGFSLQAQSRFANGKVDQVANEALERAFREWSQRGVCEITGKLSFVDVQHLLIETCARDGEFLVRKIETAANPFGFALQVLDVDRLDVERNEVFPDGRRIVMGVELSAAGSPLAYHLLSAHPSETGHQIVRKWERVPAGEIYHGYRQQRPEQTRGVPWMHTAMARLNHLSGFEEAAVIAARVGASKMGWFTSPDGSPAETLADSKDDAGIPYMNAEPGAFGVLPTGMDFKPFNPDYPNDTFQPFVKAMLRGIASGLGVAYHTLANDLEGVNFSSARAGTLEERDNWMATQAWFADAFLYPLFADWVKHALLHNAIRRADGAPLEIDVERYRNVIWQGRRWQWVDPLKDIEANIAAIGAGLKSRREVVAEQGRDLEDVWLQLQAEQRQAQELGIALGGQPATAAMQEPTGDKPKEQDDD